MSNVFTDLGEIAPVVRDVVDKLASGDGILSWGAALSIAPPTSGLSSQGVVHGDDFLDGWEVMGHLARILPRRRFFSTLVWKWAITGARSFP